MAKIKNLQNGTSQYLLPHHYIGRYTERVDTYINNNEVSNIHALIEWQYQAQSQSSLWAIKDDSTNGTWINGERLTPNTLFPLQLGQRIAFAHEQNEFLEIIDLAPPHNMLVNTTTNDSEICLNAYNLLPVDQPEWILWLDQEKQQWYIKRSDDHDGDRVMAIEHGKNIHFGGQVWRTFFPVLSTPTTTTSNSIRSLHQFDFVFDVSQDEETVKLTLKYHQQEIDLKAKAQFELMLYLARKKQFDCASHLPNKEQGWVSSDIMQKDLGISESHINISIHRLRAYFAEQLQDIAEQDYLLERRKGRIRIGIDPAKLTIRGGNQATTQNVQ